MVDLNFKQSPVSVVSYLPHRVPITDCFFFKLLYFHIYHTISGVLVHLSPLVFSVSVSMYFSFLMCSPTTVALLWHTKLYFHQAFLLFFQFSLTFPAYTTKRMLYPYYRNFISFVDFWGDVSRIWNRFLSAFRFTRYKHFSCVLPVLRLLLARAIVFVSLSCPLNMHY
jgi:hypothetical protein